MIFLLVGHFPEMIMEIELREMGEQWFPACVQLRTRIDIDQLLLVSLDKHTFD